MRFRVLDEDEEDEDGEETRHVRAVDSWVCEASANWKADKKSRSRLGVGEIVVDSAADESCWPKGQGDAFSTKPSKKNIILKTANGGEMGHYGEKEVTFRTGTDVDVVRLKFPCDGCKETPFGGEEAGGEGQRGDVRAGARPKLHTTCAERKEDPNGEKRRCVRDQGPLCKRS